MRQAAVAGIFRGDDSTGLLQVDKNFNVDVVKAPVDGYTFSMHKRAKIALSNVDSNYATILHHRAATHGSIAYDNCHPFEHEMDDGSYLAGVHNGTVGQFKRKEDGLDFDVDSDWLYYRIARDGAEKTLAELNTGSFALVWAERPSNRLYIAADGQRPIHWAAVKGKNIILVASESGMLYWLANRNGLAIEQIYYPPAGSIFEFDPAKDLRDWSHKEIKRSTKPATVEPKPPVVYSGKDDGNTSIGDTYGADTLKKTDFGHIERVTFVMGSSSPIAHGKVEIYGEVISNKALVAKAVIAVTSQTTVDNLKSCIEAECDVIGVRRVVKKQTGEVEEFLIVTPPAKIYSATDDEQLAALDTLDKEDKLEQLCKGPTGRMISEKTFRSLTKDGCANCTGDITLMDQDFITWTGSPAAPVCQSCAEFISNGAEYAS